MSGGRFVVLVLASGKGRRFIASGGEGSKLQATLGGRPVLDWTADAVRRSGLDLHVEDRGHEGMGDSIAAAVAACPDAAGWLILPGDLPLVQPHTLAAVADQLAAHPLVVPAWRGQRGHPVGFARGFGPALRALSGPGGAAAIVRANTPFVLEVDDPGVVTDIDTVSDLAAAQALLETRQTQ